MAEISFEPAVICWIPSVFLNTLIKRVILPILSDQYTVLDHSSPSASPNSTSSLMESISLDMVAHCFTSRFTSSAERRSSWILSMMHDILQGNAYFSLSQMALISPDASDKNDS